MGTSFRREQNNLIIIIPIYQVYERAPQDPCRNKSPTGQTSAEARTEQCSRRTEQRLIVVRPGQLGDGGDVFGATRELIHLLHDLAEVSHGQLSVALARSRAMRQVQRVVVAEAKRHTHQRLAVDGRHQRSQPSVGSIDFDEFLGQQAQTSEAVDTHQLVLPGHTAAELASHRLQNLGTDPQIGAPVVVAVALQVGRMQLREVDEFDPAGNHQHAGGVDNRWFGVLGRTGCQAVLQAHLAGEHGVPAGVLELAGGLGAGPDGAPDVAGLGIGGADANPAEQSGDHLGRQPQLSEVGIDGGDTGLGIDLVLHGGTPTREQLVCKLYTLFVYFSSIIAASSSEMLYLFHNISRGSQRPSSTTCQQPSTTSKGANSSLMLKQWSGKIRRRFMNTSLELRTAESVSPKHPDKLCDQISDAILDAYLAQDPDARVAVEALGGHGQLVIMGEITSTAKVDIQPIVDRLVGPIKLAINLVEQSPEIAQGVDTGGAGDQGIMVGYATNETPEFLPLEVVLSRKLNQHLYKLWPHDGKTQVTLRGTTIIAIVASFQHAKQAELLSAVNDWLSEQNNVDPAVKIHANPAGDWSQGGFDADTGLTGRKLVVDNYGPRIPIGGGCYSGKDASKVDRSAAYMARRIAVDYLKKTNANEVFTRLAYAIGYDQPLEATVIIDGKPQAIIGYDLTPRGIVDFLDLKKPRFEERARWGHYGLDQDRTNAV